MKTTSTVSLLQQYKRFIEVSQNLASTLELGPLLDNIMEVAVELVDGEEASILLYNQHTHRLYFEAATNADRTPELQKIVVPEESIAGWVALNRKAQIVNNVKQDERHYDYVEKKTRIITRSLAAVPLIAKDKLIGVLEVLNKKTGEFDTEDQEILQALASQAAIAIGNSRLFQQSDLITEFVHELRTPLTSIATAAFLLQRAEINADQRINMAQTIHQETQRLNELASVFLDLASLESGRATLHPVPIKVMPLLEECLQVVQIKAAERDIQLHLDISEAELEMEADREKLKRVVLNLLNNAVKYNCANGQIWLKAWKTPGQVFLSIQDSGVGIPPDQISQLFTRFFRASNVERTTPGTGLGLSISKRIIEMHEGTIQVESQLNVGTTFTIQMPLQQNQ